MTSWWTHIIQCTKYWVEIQTHSWRMCRRCTSFINKFTFDTNLNMETSSAGESLQSSLGFALITSPSQQVFLYKYVWYLNWLSVFWTRPLISLTVSSCISVAASVCAKPSLWKFPSFTYRAPLVLILALHSRGVRMIDSSVFCRSCDLSVRCAAASWRLHRIWPLLLFPVLIFTIPVKKKKKTEAEKYCK